MNMNTTPKIYLTVNDAKCIRRKKDFPSSLKVLVRFSFAMDFYNRFSAEFESSKDISKQDLRHIPL